MLWVEAVRDLGSKVRENLRIPVSFQSFIYLEKGRLPIESYDLSCGGIAFFCDGQLKEGQQMEVVIPVTSQPLVLRMKILRQRPSPRPQPLYAAEFLDLLREEENMVREAVFSIQLQRKPH